MNEDRLSYVPPLVIFDPPRFKDSSIGAPIVPLGEAIPFGFAYVEQGKHCYHVMAEEGWPPTLWRVQPVAWEQAMNGISPDRCILAAPGQKFTSWTQYISRLKEGYLFCNPPDHNGPDKDPEWYRETEATLLEGILVPNINKTLVRGIRLEGIKPGMGKGELLEARQRLDLLSAHDDARDVRTSLGLAVSNMYRQLNEVERKKERLP